MTVAIYTRISTPDQNSELQLRELRDYVQRQGWEIAAAYQDLASGAKGKRPGLAALMEAAREGKFSCVLVWKLDRFGRSLVDCLNNIRELENHQVRFVAVTQGLDTDLKNPAARFLLQILGAAAEFERSLILELVQAGQARYRQDYLSGKVGKTVHSRSGKDLPAHRPRKIFDREKVVRLRQDGLSLRQIASSMGIGLGTVSRTLQERVPKDEGQSPGTGS